MDIKSSKKIKVISWLLFITYIAFMVYVLFISSYYNRVPRAISYNLVPFRTVKMYIRHYKSFNLEIWLTNLLGNVVVFMPLGLLLPIISKRTRGFIKILFITMLSSLAAEATQLYLRVGSFDIDDIILNTLGGILGYLIYKLLRWLIKKPTKKKR